jgi:hypothetical protein
MNIRNRLAALEGRVGSNDAARQDRRIARMSDAELDAAIAAQEAADPQTDDEIRASVAAGILTAPEAEHFIALRASWLANRNGGEERP